MPELDMEPAKQSKRQIAATGRGWPRAYEPLAAMVSAAYGDARPLKHVFLSRSCAR